MQGFPGTGNKPHVLRLDVVRHVFDQRAVLVQKNRAGARAHGHDVSRMGRTMTSGMTVSAGCVSKKQTVAATFAGSCNTPRSRSGKRSSKNGVRMPPAITALTLMPCGRNSACMAWLRPSRPHLLAWYALAFGQARFAAVEATFTMCPRPRLRIRLAACCEAMKGPRRLVRITASHCSID